MVGTNRRRGQAVNMPDFLDNLNEVAAVGEASPEDNGTTLDEELAIFTNTSFIDWDAKHPSFSLESLDEPSAPSASAPMAEPASATTEVGDLTSFDFGTGDYGFDFSNPYVAGQAAPQFADNLGNLQPIQPTPAFPHPAQRGYPAQSPQAGDKRKAEVLPSPRQYDFEGQSRVAAEEDKRRRNTAASARFRVKKKAREQALEKREKELNDKVGSLEGRIQTLETENKWLRELVMEKNGGSEKVVSALLDEQKSRDASTTSKAKA